MKNVNNIFELAEFLNTQEEKNPEADLMEIISAYADENPEIYCIEDNDWDYITDGKEVLYLTESGEFSTYSLSASYAPSDAAIADSIKGGCVFTTNGDPAHTFDYPSMLSAILYKIDKEDVKILRPTDSDYSEEAEKLDLPAAYTEDIYMVDDILFAVA